MNDCIFCKIVRGEIPCYKVYENSNYMAFLDVFPNMVGQVLVVPKNHSEYLFEMKDSEYSELMLIVKKISNAMMESISPVKVAMVVEGLEVSHVHVKLYPLMEDDFLNITSKVNVSSDKMNDIAKNISKGLK